MDVTVQRGRRAARIIVEGLTNRSARCRRARYRPVGATRDGPRVLGQRGREDHAVRIRPRCCFPTKGGRWSRAMTWCATRLRSAGRSGWRASRRHPGGSPAGEPGDHRAALSPELGRTRQPRRRAAGQFGLSDAAERAGQDLSRRHATAPRPGASLVGRRGAVLDEPPPAGSAVEAGDVDIIRSLVADGTTLLLTRSTWTKLTSWRRDRGHRPRLVIAAGTRELRGGRRRRRRVTVPDRGRIDDAAARSPRSARERPLADPVAA